MMKNFKALTIGMLVVPFALLGLGVVFASSVATPNTFTAGTAAVASQVNANFAAHAAAINDNDTTITANTAAIAALQAQHASAGNIRAIVHVNADGTFGASWMANGNTPTLVSNAPTGTYRINFPGENVANSGTNRCLLANSTVLGGSVTVSGLPPDAYIRVYSPAGVLTNNAFWLMITGAP